MLSRIMAAVTLFIYSADASAVTPDAMDSTEVTAVGPQLSHTGQSVGLVYLSIMWRVRRWAPSSAASMPQAILPRR